MNAQELLWCFLMPQVDSIHLPGGECVPNAEHHFDTIELLDPLPRLLRRTQGTIHTTTYHNLNKADTFAASTPLRRLRDFERLMPQDRGLTTRRKPAPKLLSASAREPDTFEALSGKSKPLSDNHYQESEDVCETLHEQYQVSFAFIKRSPQHTQQDHLLERLSAEHVWDGKTNRRNPTLTERLPHILPYRGFGRRAARALCDWPHVQLVDDRRENEFKASLPASHPLQLRGSLPHRHSSCLHLSAWSRRSRAEFIYPPLKAIRN